MNQLFIFVVILFPFFANSQTPGSLTGMVTDRQTKIPLPGANISIYSNGALSGNITNEEGKFNLKDPDAIDSIKFSMIGYNNTVIVRPLTTGIVSNIRMDANPVDLEEVVIRPLSAIEIVQKAASNTTALLPQNNYENTNFYRELIKNNNEYFSVAEAVFSTQYYPSKKSYKLKLEKGRSKEDVIATRLFEDFHPGGGPEGLNELSFNIGFPEFLTPKKMKSFEYRKDSVTVYDGRTIYIISFDQKPDVHEALEKGKIFIDAGGFTILKYEAYNSPRGMPYLKNLKGTDKLLAELLHIDFQKKGWSKQASYKKVNDKLIIDRAKETFYIGYKQPKKNLDLDLTIATEMVVTDNYGFIKSPISSSDEWKRKNMTANLPRDFDKDFWGDANIISPSDKVENIIASIGKKNEELIPGTVAAGWLYHQKNTFVTAQQNDSIVLIPIMKSNWEDSETGGMIFREVAGDFTVETAVNISRRSDVTQVPDKGFQQSGIIIRDAKLPVENSIALSIGTGGNSKSKFFLRKTDNGKSRETVDKIDALNGYIKLEKKGNLITGYFRKNTNSSWETVNSYRVKWDKDSLQAGMTVMAHFAGNGPKMKPDMKAVFTGFTIIKSDDLKLK